MKKSLSIAILILLTLSIAFLTSCTSLPPNSPEDKLFCNLDNECVCGGIDKETNSCYLGNIKYFEKNVDKTKDCPDFCTGIANNLEVKCISNQCQHIQKPKPTETQTNTCKTDADCIKAGCSNTLCIAKSKQNEGFTTCEWKDSYKCYQEQNCVCIQGKCSWSNQEELNTCIGMILFPAKKDY